MDFKRDRKKPFTREELERLELLARHDGNELVEQMAGVIMVMEEAIEKTYDREKELLDQASAFLKVAEIYLPKDEETIGGRISKRLKDGFGAFVKGLKTGKLKPELTRIHWEPGTPFETQFRTNWAMMVIAGSISKMLMKKDGSYWNNITCVMHHLGETFDVIVQRRSGKSVKDQLNEAEAKIAKIREGVEHIKKHELWGVVQNCDSVLNFIDGK